MVKRVIFLLITAVFFLSGCAAPAGLPQATAALPTPTSIPTPSPMPTPTRPELPRGPGAVWHLVVIGDSSLWELGKAFAAQIEKDEGVKVELADITLGSLSARDVLDVLQTGKSYRGQLEQLPGALKDAEVVVMFVNPVIDPQQPFPFEGCFMSMAPTSCDPAVFETWINNLKAIWAKIFELRAGQPTILRATDLYNPLVSSWNESGVFKACTDCWVNISNAARSAADAYHIPFLSRFDAFNGVNHNEDPVEKGFIVSDGEHPTELAAQFTAELLSKMGYEPVPAP